MRRMLALWVLVGLAGCDGGPPDDSATGAPAGTTIARDATAAVTGSNAAARGVPSPAQTTVPIRLTLLGEIDLPDGGVQRSYRALLHPGSAAPAGLRAELVSAGAGRRVTQGVVRFDADAHAHAHGPVAGDRSLQIVQPDTQPLDPAALHWVLTPLDALQGTHGALLPGAPGALASAALRDYRWSAMPGVPSAGGASGARLAAVLRADAQVKDVNQALRETGLRIASMRPGNHTLELRAVRGGGDAALQPLAQRLQAGPAFQWVRVQAAAPAAAADPITAAADPDACEY